MASAWLPTAADLFEELSDATGLDLVALADDADACGGSTRVGQPAITAVALAAFAALADAGVTPDVVAGHSLGEVTAAVAAGVFTPPVGTALVTARGAAMGRACRATPGTMAAVLRLDAAAVGAAVDRIPGAVVANINSTDQVVLSGTQDGVAAASDRCRELGARVLPLDVEGAFHSTAMTPAVVAMATALSWTPISDPLVPLVSGIDGCVRTTADGVRSALVDGILAPVRWADVMDTLVARGVRTILEVGPGGVLAGLARRSAHDLEVLRVATPDDVAPAVDAIRVAAAVAAA
jgi:[acyl-carrier-protein] S-malonyltransferase